MEYRMAFLIKVGPIYCPVKGCSCQAATWTAMQMEFCYRHVRYTVVILDKDNLPHPWCPLCDILMSWRYLNRQNQRTAKCKKGVEWKRQRLATVE